MSFSRPLEAAEKYTKIMVRMQELVGNLKPLITEGHCKEEYSKPYAELICDDVMRSIKRILDEHVLERLLQNQCQNDEENDGTVLYNSASSSSSNPYKPRMVTRRTRNMIKKEKVLDIIQKRSNDSNSVKESKQEIEEKYLELAINRSN